MLTYALDTPAPATIVLISGDRDFVYAVSVLRLRRYRVVLVAPQQTHNSLRSQATAVLDWSTDVLGKEKPTGLPTPGEPSRSAHRRSQSSVYSTTAPASPFAAKSQRRLSFGLPIQRPGIEPLQSAANPKSPRVPTTPLQEAWTPAEDRMPDTARSQSGLLRPQVSQHALPTPLSEPTSSNLSLKTTLDDAVYLDDPEADIADLNLHLKNLTNRSFSNTSPSVRNEIRLVAYQILTRPLSQPYIAVTPVEENKTEEQSSGQPADITTQSSTPVDPTSGTDAQVNEPSERSQRHASLSLPEVKEFVRGNDVPSHSAAYKIRIPVQRNPSTPEPSEGATAPAAEQQQAGNDLLRPASAPASVVSSASELSSAVEYTSSVDYDSVSGLDGTSPADASVQREGQPAFAPEASLAEGPRPSSPTRADAVHSMLTALSTRTPPPETSSLPLPPPDASHKPDCDVALAFSWLDPHFANLVRVMQELHAKSPKPELLRSTVAILLSQRHKGEYKQAGYADFKAFSTSAEQRGLVTMGGSQGYAWMKLEPEWFGCS